MEPFATHFVLLRAVGGKNADVPRYGFYETYSGIRKIKSDSPSSGLPMSRIEGYGPTLRVSILHGVNIAFTDENDAPGLGPPEIR